MRIGIPKEIKEQEHRVAATPAGVAELVRSGHEVLVQSGAGAAIGFPDMAYQSAGARVVPDATAATSTSPPHRHWHGHCWTAV